MRHQTTIFTLLCLGGTGLETEAQAKSKWESQGQLALESRVFSNDQSPDTVDLGLGLFGRLELEHKHKPFREKVRLYGRMDQQDMRRTILVVEELWAAWDFGPFELRVGADILNWSATEAFHPADVINARNIDSDAENYEKVGEPMVQLSTKLGRGSLKAIFMPYYSQPILPSSRSRLNFLPPNVVNEELEFLRLDFRGRLTDGRFGPQGALRFTQTIGDADLDVHVIHHMDRYQPEVLFDATTGAVVPLFRAVTQVGGTYQHVVGDFVFKLEAGYRWFVEPENGVTPYGPVQDRNHLQVAVGAEYGLVNDEDVEQTFILEAQSIFGVDDDIRKSLQLFQRDAMLGYRVTIGDVDSTEILLSVIMDLEAPENVFWSANFKQRFLETWSISAGARMVFAPENPTAGGFAVPPGASHVRLVLTRHF